MQRQGAPEHPGDDKRCSCDSMGERLPSADRSQRISNAAGRHRDSAARLRSAFHAFLPTEHKPYERI
jgi:hypothetical protein